LEFFGFFLQKKSKTDAALDGRSLDGRRTLRLTVRNNIDPQFVDRQAQHPSTSSEQSERPSTVFASNLTFP